MISELSGDFGFIIKDNRSIHSYIYKYSIKKELDKNLQDIGSWIEQYIIRWIELNEFAWALSVRRPEMYLSGI